MHLIRNAAQLWTISILALIGAIGQKIVTAEPATSEWVRPGPDGKLVYKTTVTGDRIMDFSHAGYMGGGVALPNVPVKKTLEPSGGEDDTVAIQAAIDEVSKLPLENGFRGTVLLAPGTYPCEGTIRISTSGVVLRGSGSESDQKTTIKMIGGRHSAFSIGGDRGGRRRGRDRNRDSNEGAPPEERAEAARQEFTAAETTIADDYVAAGTNRFSLADAAGFAVGDTIAIRRPTTDAWVEFMQMHNLARNGRPQTWIGRSRSGVTERKIAALDGNTITLDIPLADSYNAKYLNPPGTTVAKMRPATRITQAGIEQLHILSPPQEMPYGRAPYSAIRINGEDCWVRDVYCQETMNSTVLQGKRLTLERVRVHRTVPNLGASKPTDFSIEGSQILLDRCFSSGDNVYNIWTGSLQPGPNVVLNCTFADHGRIQPHHRWSTGLLVDGCQFPDGGIDFMNRGVMGSGHGWTMAWGVVWNCTARSYVVQNPPGAANWVIGSIGKSVPTPRPFDAGPDLPPGIFDSHGVPVEPRSLYLAQLAERLGPQAVVNIGYPQPSNSDDSLGQNQAIGLPLSAGNVRDRAREFAGERAVDGDETTYWATNDEARRATLEIDTEGPLVINAVEIREAIGLSDRVQRYRVEGQIDSDWKLLAEGTTIGDRRVHRFPQATVWKVRLSILESQAYPAIREFGLYLDATSPADGLVSGTVPPQNQDSSSEK